MSMKEKKKPENGGRKPYTKPVIKREALGRLNPFLNSKPRPDEELDSGLKQKTGPDDDYSRREDSPFSSSNPGASTHDYREHSVEYDPKTGKSRYRGQRTDFELPNGRTISPEELAKRREPEKKGERPRENAEYRYRNLILDIWNAKIDTEKGEISAPEDKKESKSSEEQFEVKVGGSCSDLPTLSPEELERILKYGLRGTEIKWDGAGSVQAYKERVAKELGKDVEDVTDEDIRKSFLAYWNFDSKPEPERVRWWGDEDPELPNGSYSLRSRLLR